VFILRGLDTPAMAVLQIRVTEPAKAKEPARVAA